jgi:hypothetical protein
MTAQRHLVCEGDGDAFKMQDLPLPTQIFVTIEQILASD